MNTNQYLNLTTLDNFNPWIIGESKKDISDEDKYAIGFAKFEESQLEDDIENNSLAELMNFYLDSLNRAYGANKLIYLRIIIKIMNEKIRQEHC